MKRLVGIAMLAAAAAVALALPAAGTGAPPDVKGPKCANIFLTANYSGTLGGPATVSGNLTTPTAPSCSTAVYTVYVYDASGTTLLGSQTFSGDGVTDEFAYSIAVSNAPQQVCVSATSTIGGHIADAAPNSGCGLLELNPPGGGASGFG
jgi:hypothetical protein